MKSNQKMFEQLCVCLADNGVEFDETGTVASAIFAITRDEDAEAYENEHQRLTNWADDIVSKAYDKELMKFEAGDSEYTRKEIQQLADVSSGLYAFCCTYLLKVQEENGEEIAEEDALYDVKKTMHEFVFGAA